MGVDVGGTKMLAALFDQNFKLLVERKEKTNGREGAKAVVNRLQTLIVDTLREAEVSRKQLGGIGVGCPGPVNVNTGVVLAAPNLGWHNLPLRKKLETELGRPVLILNDVDAGTYGEYRFGAGEQARCVLGLFPGTGIGGGCIYEGRIMHGSANSCFEVGHMLVVPGGRLCGCGRHGCLEAHASRLAVAADAVAAVYRGQAPALRELAGTDLSEVRSRTLAKAIIAGDEVVAGIVHRAAYLLGTAAASIVNLIAPDVVVLGGGLVEALEKIYVEEVRRAITEQAMSFLGRPVKIRAAKLGDRAGILGCAALAADAFGGKKRKS
ncbi:MAG: ROK family protein [Verrucomicrobia bacterium]|nr:MAG: ROK family protein [Verrucomicrobiota bacterium]